MKKVIGLAFLAISLSILAVLAWGDSDEEWTGVINADFAHTDECPFCIDGSCACHEDTAEIANAAQYIEDGEMTVAEADRYYHGKTI